MKMLVTGGGGFLGLALCRALADALAVPLEFALEDGQLQARIGPLPAL